MASLTRFRHCESLISQTIRMVRVDWLLVGMASCGPDGGVGETLGQFNDWVLANVVKRPLLKPYFELLGRLGAVINHERVRGLPIRIAAALVRAMRAANDTCPTSLTLRYAVALCVRCGLSIAKVHFSDAIVTASTVVSCLDCSYSLQLPAFHPLARYIRRVTDYRLLLLPGYDSLDLSPPLDHTLRRHHEIQARALTAGRAPPSRRIQLGIWRALFDVTRTRILAYKYCSKCFEQPLVLHSFSARSGASGFRLGCVSYCECEDGDHGEDEDAGAMFYRPESTQTAAVLMQMTVQTVEHRTPEALLPNYPLRICAGVSAGERDLILAYSTRTAVQGDSVQGGPNEESWRLIYEHIKPVLALIRQRIHDRYGAYAQGAQGPQ
jgi:hypothetical protein